jgi:hypothetical protein
VHCASVTHDPTVSSRVTTLRIGVTIGHVSQLVADPSHVVQLASQLVHGEFDP